MLVPVRVGVAEAVLVAVRVGLAVRVDVAVPVGTRGEGLKRCTENVSAYKSSMAEREKINLLTIK